MSSRSGQTGGSASRRPHSSKPAEIRDDRHRISIRAVLLGLTGAIAIGALQVVVKATPQTVILPFQSVLTLLSGVIFWLFLLAVLNLLLRRWQPRFALRPSEFAVIYGIAAVASSIGAADEVMQLFPMWVYPFRKTQDVLMGPFRQYIPHWIIPQSPAVVEPYYSGGVSFWQPALLKAWAVPLMSWMLWLMAFGAVMWAWNVILRRRWMDQDRLSFPCSQLPLEICRAGGFGGPVSGSLFWSGVLIAATLESLNQAHARFPVIPSIPLGFNASPLLDTSPGALKALSPMYLDWNTLYLGVSYFVPLDILFSGWFFYLLRKAMEVFGYANGGRDLGWDAPGFPYSRSQAAGAWIALFFVLVWAERRHLGGVLRAALSPGAAGNQRDENDTEEFGSYRAAGRVLVLGTLFLVAFSVSAGMSISMAMVFYAFFWALNVTMTRVYAQVGPPILELYFLDPQQTITTLFGTFWQSPRSLTNFSLMYWINRTDRGHPMAHQMSAFYIGKSVGVSPRPYGQWILVAFVVGCLTCLLTYLHWAYRLGEDQFVQGGWRETFSPVAVARINQWVRTPKGPNLTEIAFVIMGAVTTLALAKVNYTVIGCPFHPIGFALAMCYGMEYDWPAFLGMWLVKTLLLRYGGRSLFTRLRPFFLGVILGGLVSPVIWGFLNWLFEWYH